MVLVEGEEVLSSKTFNHKIFHKSKRIRKKTILSKTALWNLICSYQRRAQIFHFLFVLMSDLYLAIGWPIDLTSKELWLRQLDRKGACLYGPFLYSFVASFNFNNIMGSYQFIWQSLEVNLTKHLFRKSNHT